MVCAYGDVNCDGKVTPHDAKLVLQAVAGSLSLNDDQQKSADVTGDGKVSANDSAVIMQYIVGLISKFPVEMNAITVKIIPLEEQPKKVARFR